MGTYVRQDFSAGWSPSFDAFNAPKNALLRMDNLVLDELGIVSLRQGSAKINSSAFSDVDVHSLFTTTLSGARYRMSGCTNAVYANGTSIASSLAGSGDISFGAHRGQILFARATSKKKYDGTTVRTWGIAAPGAAPTLTALSADSKTFATCSSTESPGMTSNEGTQAFQPDKAGTANAAVEITPDSTTGRGTSTLTFAGATDFTAYTGGQTGTEDDLIDFYVYLTEPQYVTEITLMVDVNDGTFQEDWYDFTFKPGDAIDVSSDNSLDSNYDVEGYDRNEFRSRLDNDIPEAQTTFRADKPAANVGWNHFNVPRGKMVRHGLTSGKNWSTVKAVRITFLNLAGGAAAVARFDEIKIIGGAARPLTGKFKAAIVAVRNDGTYEEKSAPSAYSTEIELKAQGVRATLDATTIGNLDTQVNELWLFLFGGGTDGFYRFAVNTSDPFSGSTTIDATNSVRTAMIAKIRMETANTTPPDSIIGIEGPHFDRTLCLTATKIHPSRRLNPGSYSTDEEVTVGDNTETALWIKKVAEGGLFVGTTRDVYRFDGDWTPLPDGSINVTKRSMGVSSPPISSTVATGQIDGVETLVYLSGDGWRVLGGELLVDNAVALLWKGYERHGVSAVNITGTTARFRVAITKNQLVAITPEGSDTTSSVTLHKYDFSKQRWYRHVYPQAFRSIFAEKDGTLIAGDSAGYVRTLDYATKTDDGFAIPVVLWTSADDNGQPFNYKDGENLLIRLETSSNATISYHLNGSSTADTSTTTNQATTETGVISMTAVSEFTQLQLRIAGDFSTFNLRGLDVHYLDAPLPRVVHDTGFIDLGIQTISWVRNIVVKAKSATTLTVTPYFDGTAYAAQTISVAAHSGTPYPFQVPLGREAKGRQARVLVTSDDPSQVYWIELQYSQSGKQKQKRIERFVGAA